ncbi:hypothetical protein AVEN_52770-1 [Araneus ventricosus]|uniref:DUF7041 domain-containing protein n=1 Tax=Araneus ventricosus TaxID=182803 RepID=A0A4Y2CY80_ARAVE|nr:hypothetical protein AVEN_52770-1 [Araneus ventricosus]
MTTQSEVDSARELGRVSFKAPPFWKSNPELWFLQLKFQCITAGITQESTKFHCIVSCLDYDVLTCVSNLIRSPPSDNSYTQLKDKIICQYADSENVRLKRLLQDLQLGDKTSSQLLMKIKELNNGRVTDEVLKTLFLQRLPLSMQQILSACDDGLDKLAQIADKIGETTASVSVIGEVLTRPSLSMIEAKVEELTNQVQRLSRELSRQKKPL